MEYENLYTRGSFLFFKYIRGIRNEKEIKTLSPCKNYFCEISLPFANLKIYIRFISRLHIWAYNHHLDLFQDHNKLHFLPCAYI